MSVKFSVVYFLTTVSSDCTIRNYRRFMELPGQLFVGMLIKFDPKGLQAFEKRVVEIWLDEEYPDHLCVELESIEVVDCFDQDEIELVELMKEWECLT